MILDKLKWRYATKKFDVERRVSEENIQRLKEAIQLAPSSYGLQPLKVLIITNKELREQLKPLSWNQPQITEASHLFVFCNKTNVAEQEINALIALKAETLQRSPENFKGYGDFILSKMKEKSSLEQSVWTAKQAYIAMSNLIMACAALEIDSCPMEGFEQEAYNKILKLNEQGCAAAVVVAVGYRDVSDAGQHMPKVRKSFSDLFTRLD